MRGTIYAAVGKVPRSMTVYLQCGSCMADYGVVDHKLLYSRNEVCVRVLVNLKVCACKTGLTVYGIRRQLYQSSRSNINTNSVTQENTTNDNKCSRKINVMLSCKSIISACYNYFLHDLIWISIIYLGSNNFT